VGQEGGWNRSGMGGDKNLGNKTRGKISAEKNGRRDRIGKIAGCTKYGLESRSDGERDWCMLEDRDGNLLGGEKKT